MTISGLGVSPPASLPNLNFGSGPSSSSGVPSIGPQWLLSWVLSLSKIRSPYLAGAGSFKHKSVFLGMSTPPLQVLEVEVNWDQD